MTARIDHHQLLADARIVPAPVIAEPRSCTDHNFELPTGIYVAMALLFAGAIAVMAAAFRSDMIVSYGIVFAFLGAFFAVPAIFVKATDDDGTKPLSWFAFRTKGIETANGHAGAGEATILALVLPFFIFCWAVAIVTIAALV